MNKSNAPEVLYYSSVKICLALSHPQHFKLQGGNTNNKYKTLKKLTKISLTRICQIKQLAYTPALVFF